MAYLIGIVSPDEEAELKRRGWDVEEFSEASFEEISQTVERTNGTDNRVVMVYVDSNLFDVMSGPDWDKGDVNS